MMRGATGIAFITVSMAAGIGGWVWVLAVQEAAGPPPAVEIPVGDPIDSAPKASAPEEAKAPEASDESFAPVDLAGLGAYDYDPPKAGDPGREHLIPEEIKALDGRRVAVRGIVIPWEVDREGIRSFILSPRFFGCCFGDMAKLNEIIMVRMSGDGRVKHTLMTGYVTACGELSVSEERDTDGYTLSLYRMTCEKVIYENE